MVIQSWASRFKPKSVMLDIFPFAMQIGGHRISTVAWANEKPGWSQCAARLAELLISASLIGT